MTNAHVLKKQRVIAKPRISVNKLAELLECANPSKRKSIILGAKYPKEYIGGRYHLARPLFKEYLSGQITAAEVSATIQICKARSNGSDWESEDAGLSALALESLLKIDRKAFEKFEFSEPAQNEYVVIAGVEISVNPDLILKRTVSGKKQVGGLKVHISKNTPLTDEAQKVVGLLVHMFVERSALLLGEVSVPKLCLSYDAFKKHLESAPASFKERLLRIEATCEEIALRWPSL